MNILFAQQTPEPITEEVERKTYPLSRDKVFGPTIQGEGPLQGMMTWFCRTSFCDFNCGYEGNEKTPSGAFVCDTGYAISPQHPGWEVHWRTAEEIVADLEARGAMLGDYVAISGGNPALYVDENFVRVVGAKFRLTMETQGSKVLKPEVNRGFDVMVISPKPPSSKMHKRMKTADVAQLLYDREGEKNRVLAGITALKYVSAGPEDLEWIIEFDHYVKVAYRMLATSAGDYTEGEALARVMRYISICSPVTDRMSIDEFRKVVLDDLAVLYNTIATDRRLNGWRGSAQGHAIAYGPKGEAVGAYVPIDSL